MQVKIYYFCVRLSIQIIITDIDKWYWHQNKHKWIDLNTRTRTQKLAHARTHTDIVNAIQRGCKWNTKTLPLSWNKRRYSTWESWASTFIHLLLLFVRSFTSDLVHHVDSYGMSLVDCVTAAFIFGVRIYCGGIVWANESTRWNIIKCQYMCPVGSDAR